VQGCSCAEVLLQGRHASRTSVTVISTVAVGPARRTRLARRGGGAPPQPQPQPPLPGQGVVAAEGAVAAAAVGAVAAAAGGAGGAEARCGCLVRLTNVNTRSGSEAGKFKAR